MKPASRLFSGIRGGSLFSPLVDVVFNLMITMFVFLMIYIAVANPQEPPPPLQFTRLEMPSLAVRNDYETNIAVAGGSGNYTFILAGKQPRKLTKGRAPDGSTIVTPAPMAEGTLNGGPPDPFADHLFEPARGAAFRLSTRSGLLHVSLLDRAPEELQLPIAVVDNADPTSATADRAECWGEVNLCFFREWSGKQASDGEHEVVDCLRAIRHTFTIPVEPNEIPFDPRDQPLDLRPPARLVATAGLPYTVQLTPLGGLEPYELRLLTGSPSWLRIDPASGELSGIPREAGTFEVGIALKDAQTRQGDWQSARLARAAPGRPYITATIPLEVEVNEPLTLDLALPAFTRTGAPIAAAAVAEGGQGIRTFRAEGLPSGVEIDTASGSIHGVPTAKGQFHVEVTVTDGTNTIRAADDLTVIGPRPPARIRTPQGGS